MEVYGLVGNPVGHSLSPRLHEAAYQARDMDARYVTFEPATDALGAAIEGADALGIAGLNVTVPFKEAVLEFVEPDDLAASIGAVNTVDFDDDRPTGYNTDARGARRAFAEAGIELADRTAVVVGAGGAGRAIAWMLADAGATVHIANRTVDRAARLADAIDGTAYGLDAFPGLLRDATILVNATTVGMDEDVSPVPADALHADLAVLDAVYQPPRTRLLRDAASVGATTIPGSEMLLYQGVAAFELWTGRTAPVEAMNATLQDGL
ncbi:MAG: shikimate dehydrogenase [Halobacteriaceae archaeon]